jgi:hypothetical protein
MNVLTCGRETLRGVDGATVISSSGSWLLELTKLPNTCRDIHSKKACVIVIPRVKAPHHLLLIPRKKLVVVVMIPRSSPSSSNQIDPQILWVVVVVMRCCRGCSCSGCGRN